MLNGLVVYIGISAIFISSIIFTHGKFIGDMKEYEDKYIIKNYENEKKVNEKVYLERYEIKTEDKNIILKQGNEIIKSDKLNEKSYKYK